MSFTIFQNEKTLFQTQKTQSLKSLKLDIFPKGLIHGFGPKMAIFPTFFFQEIKATKMSFTISQNQKTPFQAINTTTSKSPKIDIFPKGVTHAFFPKVAIFGTFFFMQYRAAKCFFTIFQNEKTPFQAIKMRGSKSRKIDTFSMWLTHGFGPKMGIFATFFFSYYSMGKCPLRYFRTKKRLSRL